MGLGVPMLPMPPGLPMPGMDMPMPPATSLGSLIPGGSRRGGDENVARLAGRMEREGPHPLRQVSRRGLNPGPASKSFVPQTTWLRA